MQFGYGQSNPTYQLTDKDGKKYVLRKKPPGQLLSKVLYYNPMFNTVRHELTYCPKDCA